MLWNLDSPFLSLKRAALVVMLLTSVVQWSYAQQSTTNPTKSTPTTKKVDGSKPVATSALTAGTTAFIRVKQYSPLSGTPTLKDMFGGTGYVLRNLNPTGIESEIAKPAPNAATVYYGDTVLLVEKKAGLPVTWLVAKGQTKVELPEYLLTINKAEIDFLKKTNRIPESMALVYKETDNLKIWGVLIGGIGRYSVIDSHGMAFLDYPTGTSPFAVKGNAVMFDESAVKDVMGFSKPPVFDGGKKPLQVSSSSIYYCVSEGAKPAFERIDLKTVK